MKMDKKKAIIIAIILLTSTTLAVGAQNGWFNFIYDPMGLDIDDTYMEDDFELKDLPLWFSSDVLVIGSGFSYQEHTVSVSIYHDRPSNGAPWYADGSYSLDLKLLGTIIEPITSGSFTDLSTSNPFTTLYQWTPASPPDNYTIALNITGVTWSEMPTHTITATVGTLGGTIVSGVTTVSYGAPHDFIVLEGEPQGFNINPDSGYVIEDVLVDSSSVGPVSSYLFETVTEDHTIDATFTDMGFYSDTNVAIDINTGNCSGWTGTITSATFNGEASISVTPGSTVQVSMQIEDSGSHEGYYWDFHIEVERVGGGSRHLVADPSYTSGPFNGVTRTAGMTFPAEAGDWTVIFVVEAVYLP